jgi:hypothetical protein
MKNGYEDQQTEKLISKIEKEVEDVSIIDTLQFKELSLEKLTKTLGLTIKRDDTNKLLTFLAMLSVYTADSQINISLNAPSSSGKSYIPLELSKLFPKNDLIKLGACSPTAFFHEQGIRNKEKNEVLVNLERKIIIFLDQPNPYLLEAMRSMLSHDEKEIISKKTDKNRTGGNSTKTIVIRGYPVVIFCSTGLKIDEQEATRFLLLSPDIDPEKIKQAISTKITKESDKDNFLQTLSDNPQRQELKNRILAIRQAKIKNININNPELFQQIITEKFGKLRPRLQRDTGRILAIVKVLALLNLWFRKKEKNCLIANDQDIKNAFMLWAKVSESQDLNLPPYVLDVYKRVIVVEYDKKNQDNFSDTKIGVSRNNFSKAHYNIYGRMIPQWEMRQMIDMLETAGLIIQESDPKDKRSKLLFPQTNQQNNNEEGLGVKEVKTILN